MGLIHSLKHNWICRRRSTIIKMKVALFLLAFVACASAQQVAIPEKCEDVFTVAQCDALRAIAKRFGETATDLNNAIKEAAAKHIQNAKDILNFVQEFLVTNAKKVDCDQFLPAEQCAALKKIGGLLKVKADQVNTAVREAIAHGANTAQEIYQKAVEYVRDVLTKTTCTDFLSADLCQKITTFAKMANLRIGEVQKAIREAVIEGAANAQEIYQKAIDFLTGEITCEGILGAATCEKLQKAAQMLGEKMEDINKAIREAVTKHMTNTKDIINFVQQYLVDLATDFKCEKVMSEDLCAKIMVIGGHFKDGVDTINKAIREAIVHGATGMQEIYNVAVSWLKDNVMAKKCEDLIAPDICKRIADFAKKVHVSVNDVFDAVKEAIAEGAWDPISLYKKAIEFIKSKISCEAVMGKSMCDRIRALADKFGVSLAKLDEVLREAIASGVTKVSDLYKKIVKYILGKWTDLIGDEEMLAIGEQNDWIDITGKLRAALEKFMDEVLDQLKVVNENVRAKIKKVILEGKLRISEIKQKIKDLLEKLGNKSDDEIEYAKRGLRDDLKAALEQARGMTKLLIQQLLKLSKEKLEQAKATIKKILDQFGITQDSFIEVLLDSTHDQIMNDLEVETTFFSDMIVADMVAEADQL